MTATTVFFSRCRPQNSDAIELVLRERRIFIGYPAWRAGVEPRRDQLRKSVIDLWCPEEEWAELRAGHMEYRREYQQNRNFVRSIEPGAIGLVPRPSRGLVYAGRVMRPFELLNDPPWADDYLRLRREQGLPVGDEPLLIADVAQCWEVDRFRSIPFSLVPAWIRRSLLGRSTYGRVAPLHGYDLDPYSALDCLIDSPEQAERAWTSDLEEVGRRLVDAVGPNTFEHLCVALLQLEHPDQVWMHVGGNGDGGVDGIGSDAKGNVVGVLQCKWAYWGESVFVDSATDRNVTRQILATLIHPIALRSAEGVDLWDRHHIAALVIKNATRLPLALSLRISSPL